GRSGPGGARGGGDAAVAAGAGRAVYGGGVGAGGARRADAGGGCGGGGPGRAGRRGAAGAAGGARAARRCARARGRGRGAGDGGVREVLATCAAFCHSRVGASGRARTPTRLLDLTGDPRDPTYGLIGVASVGLRGTEQPLMRVAPHDPAGSVLLRKLIGGNPQ